MNNKKCVPIVGGYAVPRNASPPPPPRIQIHPRIPMYQPPPVISPYKHIENCMNAVAGTVLKWVLGMLILIAIAGLSLFTAMYIVVHAGL